MTEEICGLDKSSSYKLFTLTLTLSPQGRGKLEIQPNPNSIPSRDKEIRNSTQS
jgi:hypothetical protein